MANSNDCNQNSDPLKLIRDGANQEQRLSPALDPSYVPVDEHGPAHGMMFAQALSAFLKYFDSNNQEKDTWTTFFSKDPSLRLAIASVQNIDDYKSQIKSYFDFLNNLDNESKEPELINQLSYLFSCLISLAKQLDNSKEGLPVEMALKPTLNNIVQGRLAPALGRLMAWQKGGVVLNLVKEIAPPASIKLLGAMPEPFGEVLASGFSKEWITNGAADWNASVVAIVADDSVYGDTTASVFKQTNHIATHNLFTAVADQFLKAFARIVSEARLALEFTFTNWDRHDPHYALFLSFLRLMEYARSEANTLTGRHLDFYYREVLHLREKPSLPAKAHLLVELAKQAASHQVAAGELFKAGKDDLGGDAFFANTRDLIANQAKVVSLKSLYRHGKEDVGTGTNSKKQSGRLYASPVANSGDGLGGALTSVDLSWQPFYNKNYSNGRLESIQMPPADVGFAVASHYLWMAEGNRDITVDFDSSGYKGTIGTERASEIVCLFTGEKGWIEIAPSSFKATSATNIHLTVSLAGDAGAVVAYNSKTHGYSFDVITPVLLIKFRNDIKTIYPFTDFENTILKQIQLQVSVGQVKNLLLSNDFGPVDSAKPFLPFGAVPESGSSLVVGSQEIFARKNLTSCNLTIRWKNIPDIKSVMYKPREQYYPSATYDWYTKAVPYVNVTFLKEGVWGDMSYQALFDGDNEVKITIKPPLGEFNKEDQPGFQTDAQYSVKSKTGFLKLALPYGLGHKAYREALSDYILAVAKGSTTAVKPTEPYTPEIEFIAADYTSVQTIRFDSSEKTGFENRAARLFHLAPFGFAEQHPFLKTKAPDTTMYLFPQLRHLNIVDESLPEGQPVTHEAEFFIGVTGLKPPQNLALLIQVADGTANPLAVKPPHHLHWSYLRGNEWIAFNQNDIEDQTEGLLKSGIVTLSMPRDASDTNTLLSRDQHWIRVAVASKSDAVCQLILVAAQGLLSVFTDKGNDPSFAAKVLPAGTISKLAIPVSEVKKISQPFESFGGQGAESPSSFYTRVSERLRHKDRAITLWDFEKLTLEAFPEIYRVKCLNHTQYEPNDSGTGIYRELAPGHATIVTIPDHRFHNLRDPLKPFTSLGLLQDIGTFLQKRVSCFVTLHVNNPQFEEVRVTMKVRFLDGFDETYSTNLLQESITRFLSPWAFSENGNPTFGGRIYKSVIIDFVEEQPYIDYVTDVQLFHDIGGIKGTADNLFVEGSIAVSILVSVPANQHSISVINPSEEAVSPEKCSCQS